jgi:hypothetical protein
MTTAATPTMRAAELVSSGVSVWKPERPPGLEIFSDIIAGSESLVLLMLRKSLMDSPALHTMFQVRKREAALHVAGTAKASLRQE